MTVSGVGTPGTSDTTSAARTLLIVSDTLPPDPNGVALIAARTAEILAERGRVAVLGPGGASLAPAIRYHRIGRLPVGSDDYRLARPAVRTVAAAVHDAAAVVVHTLGPLGCAALYYAGQQHRHATLFLHNDLPVLMRHNLPATPATPAVEWVARRVEAWAVRRASRVVAPWQRSGHSFEVLRLAPPRYPGAGAAPSTDGSITVAYHGRVSREKAVDATVRAIARADAARGRIRLRIIGGGSQLPATLALARALRVPAEHVPWCADPREALAGAQIYVTASRTETYSMTTLEAIGCGLPLIARGVGRIPTYVEHNVNGLLFDDDDELPPMLRLLADDPAVRARLGRMAYDMSSDRSLWEQFADASCAGVASRAR